MTPVTAGQPAVAGVKVTIGGRELSPTEMDNLVELRVEQSLALPDAFLLRMTDPLLQHVDDRRWEIGAEAEISLAAPDSQRLQRVFKGQIVALQPEFTTSGAHLVVRGYDRGHLLARERRVATYQSMTAGAIARKLASQAGLSPGAIDDPGVQTEFEQQSAETDWEFLWRLARRYDREVKVEDRKLHFRRAGGGAQRGTTPTLEWGEDLLVFRPRLTGVQQVASVTARGWNPKTKQPLIATATSPAPESVPGMTRSRAIGRLPTSKVLLPAAMTVQGEANAVAQSAAARLSNAHVEAEGTCIGNPALGAGTNVKVTGVGRTYSGTYGLTSVTHVFRGTGGYQTHFTVGGRSPRTLVDLASPAAPRGVGQSLMVGVVTNNRDPDGMGRVRVRYPALGDDTEGWWARILAPQAGAARGLLMTPLVGDEVVVAFENGDPRRPYILGSVWNGQAKPSDLGRTDGSLAVTSPKDIVVKAKGGEITVDCMRGAGGSGDVTLTAAGKVAQKATLDYTIDGQNVTAKAVAKLDAQGATVGVKSTGPLSAEGATVTVKGNGAVSVEAAGALTVKGAAVTVQASGVLRLSGAQIILG